MVVLFHVSSVHWTHPGHSRTDSKRQVRVLWDFVVRISTIRVSTIILAGLFITAIVARAWSSLSSLLRNIKRFFSQSVGHCAVGGLGSGRGVLLLSLLTFIHSSSWGYVGRWGFTHSCLTIR